MNEPKYRIKEHLGFFFVEQLFNEEKVYPTLFSFWLYPLIDHKRESRSTYYPLTISGDKDSFGKGFATMQDARNFIETLTPKYHPYPCQQH